MTTTQTTTMETNMNALDLILESAANGGNIVEAIYDPALGAELNCLSDSVCGFIAAKGSVEYKGETPDGDDWTVELYVG